MSMAKTIIHFDLNRTVLMSDAAGGRGMEDTLNYLLSEVVWGKVSEVGWRPEPNITPTSVRPNTTPPLLINYKKFVDHQFPYIQDGTDAVPEGYESASTFNKVAKKQRKDLHGTFTNADQPGSSLHSSLHKLLEHMSFDQASQKQALRTAAIIEPGLLDNIKTMIHSGVQKYMYRVGYYCRECAHDRLEVKVQKRGGEVDNIIFKFFFFYFPPLPPLSHSQNFLLKNSLKI